MRKAIFMILALLIGVLTLNAAFASDDCDGPCIGGSANSSTLDVEECLVRVNDRLVNHDVVVLKAFERGDELEIRVEFVSSHMAEDVQVMAWVAGYDRGHRKTDKIFDITPTFDVEENVAYEKTLYLEVPDDFDLDTGDELKLRIEITDKFSSSYIREYNLKIEALRHNVVIQDILLDPADRVQAGRGLFASVRVKNWGEDTEEDIKVTASIPALDLRATEYIDELEQDEATTSEDMFLRLPSCAEAGDYVVKVAVEYDDGDETVTKETTIEVLENPECGLDIRDDGADEKTVVTIPGKQDVVKGTSGTVYPIILENRGLTDRSYELTANGLDSWATHRFDPGAFVLVKAGQSETLYLYVTANEDAAEGEKVFMVSVETDGDKKQIALTGNVVAGEKESPLGDLTNLKTGLEIAFIVLIVVVIILGLVVAFSKLKGNDGDDEATGQTYY